jgi:adenine deaminase
VRRTYRTTEESRTLLDVAAGRRPADLYLDGATLLNVYSGELHPACVAIAGGRIAYIGSGRSMIGSETSVLPLAGKIVAPGYIDPHAHVLALATPVEFARRALAGGTTTLFADTLNLMLLTPRHAVVPLLGILSGMPLAIFWLLRLRSPSPLPDDSAFTLERFQDLLGVEAVRGVGEVTHWPAVYHGDGDLLGKISLALAAGRRVEGHAPGASGDRIAALAAAGWSSDHEAITPDEVLERLRAGVYTMLRHSSLRPDLPVLAAAVTETRALSGRFMLTADGSDAVTVADHGYLDHVIREAIAAGIPPVLAYQMATLNPAAYYGLDEELGGIGPGRRADIVVLDDLRNPTPEMVLARGTIAARDGRCVAEFPPLDWPQYFPARLAPSWSPDPALFDAPISGPIIHLENSVISRMRDVPVPPGVEPPPGIVRLALLDIEGRWIVRSALSNFVEHLGGLASTLNVAAYPIVAGQRPDDMAAACRRLARLGGGVVAVERGEVVIEIPLPLGGIMSAEPFVEMAAQAKRLYTFLRKHGFSHADPFYSLLFLNNDSLPDIRVTYDGVWDVRRRRVLAPRQDLPS